MIYLKACYRCDGDVEYTSDMYGAYLACLQCGYFIDSKQMAIAAARLGAAKVQAA